MITGSSAHGQGHETSWSQIVESELGIPFDQVEVLHGDTGQSPYGLGTYGSRSLAVGGTALQLTCEKVRDKARLIAAHLLECSADDLEWERRPLAGQGLARARQDDPGAGLRGLGGRLDARGRRAEPRGDDVLRPAELHVPVRLAHRRGRDRRRDRQGRDRALHGDRRLRQRHQPDDRRGPGARRHRAVDRPGAVRGDGLRRERADPDGHARRLHDPVGGRPAAHGVGAHGHAVALEPARRQGHRRGRARSRPRACVVNAAVDALSGLGIRHLEMPMQPARVWEAIQQAKAGN